MNSHFNSRESNSLNTSNSDIFIVTSNLPHINVQNEFFLNKIITLQRVTDTESLVSINDETMEEKCISEEIPYYQNS